MNFRGRAVLKKIVITILLLVFVIVIAVPPLTYNYALSLIDDMPDKSEVIIISEKEIWAENEPKANRLNFNSITPYWFYKWLVSAAISDSLLWGNIDPYQNCSLMASKIAITHMRDTAADKKTNGMLWWHILHSSLSVYIQRNWTAEEIAIKYGVINS